MVGVVVGVALANGRQDWLTRIKFPLLPDPKKFPLLSAAKPKGVKFPGSHLNAKLKLES